MLYPAGCRDGRVELALTISLRMSSKGIRRPVPDWALPVGPGLGTSPVGDGAVKGAIDNVKLGNLTDLLAKISPAVTAAGRGSPRDHAYVDRVAEQNVRLAMKQIREKSPTVRELLASGAVRLVGGIYDIET